MAGGNYANFFGEKSPIEMGGFAICRGARGLTGKTVASDLEKQKQPFRLVLLEGGIGIEIF